MEALFVLLVLLSSSNFAAADWCVCKSDQPSSVLLKTMNYACGNGADCNPIKQSGACYSPSTMVAHCSWATNSYFQRKSQIGGTCDFAGAATLTSTDPSHSGCTYPATASAAENRSAPVTAAPTGTTTPSASPEPVPSGNSDMGVSWLPRPYQALLNNAPTTGLLPRAELAALLIFILSFLTFA